MGFDSYHLIAKYQDDPQEGLIANVMAAGDSAARGLLAGVVLDAFVGTDAAADDWTRSMHCLDAVQKDLETLARIQGNR